MPFTGGWERFGVIDIRTVIPILSGEPAKPKVHHRIFIFADMPHQFPIHIPLNMYQWDMDGEFMGLMVEYL